MVGKVSTTFAAALGLLASLPSFSVTAAENITVVEVVKHQSQIVLGGTVVPSRQVTIAAQLPGRVELIAGTEGDSFEQNTVLVAASWFQLKLALVVGLAVYHIRCYSWMQRLRGEKEPRDTRWLRWFNEIPVVFLLGIVLLAITKPF